jgi:hypothetical protein
VITARATGDDGKEILLLGVTRENIRRLMDGQPIRVSAETHPGFPESIRVLIVFGETERTLAEALKPLIGEETKVIAVPREQGRNQ